MATNVVLTAYAELSVANEDSGGDEDVGDDEAVSEALVLLPETAEAAAGALAAHAESGGHRGGGEGSGRGGDGGACPHHEGSAGAARCVDERAAADRGDAGGGARWAAAVLCEEQAFALEWTHASDEPPIAGRATSMQRTRVRPVCSTWSPVAVTAAAAAPLVAPLAAPLRLLRAPRILTP